MSQLGNFNSLNFVSSLTGDIGGPVFSIAGNIDIIGAGGIVVTGNPITGTLTISGAALASSFVEDLGVPISPLAGVVNVNGGNNITTTGTAPNTISINLTGTTNHAVQVGNATASITSLPVGINGEGLMGATGADPAWTGSPSFSGTVTAGTGFTATTGNIVATTGNIDATVGDVNATAGTVTGLILATDGITAHTEIQGTQLVTTGTDANIDFSILPKGTGNFKITTNTDGGIQFRGLSAGFVDSEWNTYQASIQTVDATPTNIVSIPLVNSLMVSIKAVINGFQDNFSDCLGGEILVTAYRPAAGDIALVGAPIINVNYTDVVNTSDIDADINIGTESINLKVIGVAAQNWNWVTTYSFMYTISNV